MVIGNIPVWRNSNNNTLYFFKRNKLVIEEYSLSCECLERLDLGINNGWVSFMAKLYCFVSISQEDESLENSYGARSLTGAERASKFRAAHHTTADLRKLADKKLQRPNSKLTISKLAQAHERALGTTRSQRFRDNEKLKKINERRRKLR